MENEILNEKILSSHLATELETLYTNKYGQNANIDVYYYKYTAPLLKEIVQCISNPNSTKDISYFIGKKGLQKIRYYYGIDNQIDDKRKTNINSILGTLLFKIVFEAQIRYMSDKVKLDGPVPVSTPLSNFLIPAAVVNELDRYLHNNYKLNRPLLLSDLITMVEEDKLKFIRNIGELYATEMGRFVTICKVNEDKSVKEEPKSTITFSETRNIFEALVSRYEELINRKKQLEEELAGYEELKQQRDELDGEIIIFQERVKKLERKMSEDE